MVEQFNVLSLFNFAPKKCTLSLLFFHTTLYNTWYICIKKKISQAPVYTRSIHKWPVWHPCDCMVVGFTITMYLYMQSVPITTNVNLNRTHSEVYLIHYYVIKFQWLATGHGFLWELWVSFTNRTDYYDIAEILLKVALNTISITHKWSYYWMVKVINIRHHA